MRKLISIAIIGLIVASCKSEPIVDYAIVSGKITNNEEKKMSISNYIDRTLSKTILINEDGVFSDTIKPSSYNLYYGRKRIKMHLENGDHVTINFDINDFENTLAFSGQGAYVNRYLFEKGKKERALLGSTSKELYDSDEETVKAKCNELKTVLTEMILSKENISEEFKEKEKRNLTYQYLSRLKIYEKYQAYMTKNLDFKASEGFLAELNTISYVNDEDFYFSVKYKELVTEHYENLADELAKKDSIENDIAIIKIAATIPNDAIKNSILYSNVKSGITYTDNVEAYYKLFMSASTNEDHKKELTESYDQLKKLAKGSPSPKFLNYENYEGGTTSLDDLKGKYVYIDVWATWCAPCKAEIPFLKEVEKKYHGKNIEFVSISTDNKKAYDKWRATVNDEELVGIQLFADNSFDSEFVKKYMIFGIPRFILIDPVGNIVSSNAPRPSEEELIDLFNELKI